MSLDGFRGVAMHGSRLLDGLSSCLDESVASGTVLGRTSTDRGTYMLTLQQICSLLWPGQSFQSSLSLTDWLLRSTTISARRRLLGRRTNIRPIRCVHIKLPRKYLQIQTPARMGSSQPQTLTDTHVADLLLVSSC